MLSAGTRSSSPGYARRPPPHAHWSRSGCRHSPSHMTRSTGPEWMLTSTSMPPQSTHCKVCLLRFVAHAILQPRHNPDTTPPPLVALRPRPPPSTPHPCTLRTLYPLCTLRTHQPVLSSSAPSFHSSSTQPHPATHSLPTRRPHVPSGLLPDLLARHWW